jgi:hypothetical protein
MSPFSARRSSYRRFSGPTPGAGGAPNWFACNGCRRKTECRFKVKAICLPYIFVQAPCGRFQTLDVRLATLARLDRDYAKTVWKRLMGAQSKSTAGCD